MKNFKKLFLFLTAFIFSFGIVPKSTLEIKADSNNISLSGVQVRGDKDAQYFKFIVLLADNFSKATNNKDISNISSYNTTSKIKLYTSDTSEEIALSSLTDNFAKQNIWAQPGLFINISDYNYETYNGSTIYRLIIEDGCEIPVDGVKYVTNETYSFINNNYGSSDAKYSGFSWSKETVYKKENATINNVQLRGEIGNAYFGIEESHYASLPTNTTCNDFKHFNVLDKIKFYLSKEDKTGVFLSSLTSATSWVENLWSSSAFMVKIDDDKFETYNGTSVYAIEILPDCHIPCGDIDLCISSGLFFINQHQGDSSYKFANFYWGLSKNYIDTEANINGVQFRGVKDSVNDYYFVIRDEKYLLLPQGSLTNDKISFNVLNNVKLYQFKGDEGTLLKDVVSSDDQWIFNQWESGGIMFRMSSSKYEEYNGQSVYAVELLEGLDIPCGDYRLTLNSTIMFYNVNYNDLSHKFESFDWSLSEPIPSNHYDSKATSVQLRADIPGEEYYFVIQTDEHAGEIPGDFIGNKTKYNFLDNVYLYLSKEDKEGTLLSTLVDPNKNWRINLWESHGLMIPLTKQAYDIFNGSSTYGVSILEDTTIPLTNDWLTLTDEQFFINTVYGKQSYFDSGFYFVEAVKEIVDFGTVNITNIQNRANDAARWLMISVSEPFEQYMNVTALLETLNTLDKIKIYYSKEDKTGTLLRDINENIVENFLFGENTTLGIRILTNEQNIGPNMYKIVFLEGCQIPYYLNGKYGYKVVSSEFVFSNDDYKLSGDISNVYDENNMLRTYEYWSVNWTKNVIVNFTIVGIDNYTIDSIEAYAGDYLDLTKLNIDGYKMTIKTSYGSTIYKGFIPEESGINVIITYEKLDDVNVKKGCKGSVISSSIIISLLSILGLSLLSNKRKEEF